MSRVLVLLFSPWLVEAVTLHASHSSRSTSLRSSLRGEANPLLKYAADPSGLPPFGIVETAHVRPAILSLLKDANTSLADFEKTVQSEGFVASIDTLLKPAAALSYGLDNAWGLISHLKSVRDSQGLRDVVNELQPKIVSFSQELFQSRPVYNAYVQLKEGPNFKSLSKAQQRIVTKTIKDYELGGVSLSGPARVEFNMVGQKLSNLSQKYSENVLDSTKTWSKTVTDPSVLKGVPPAALAQAFQAAVALKERNGSATQSATGNATDGPWMLTLDSSTLSPVLSYAVNRDLRQELYMAQSGLASEQLYPQWDNTQIAAELLQYRQRLAELLNFRNYAELSLSNKMAKNVSKVEELLEELRTAAYSKAKLEHENLTAYAHSLAEGGLPADQTLNKWDVGFYSRKQLQSLYGLDPEQIRQYFPIGTVLQGMFSLVYTLFGVTIEEDTSGVPVWHKDVRVFRIHHNSSSEPMAHLYLDLYTRSGEKRAGAWMNALRNRGRDPRSNSDLHSPLAVIAASFRPPASANQDANLSFSEVHTLFHEMGHALQTMLTTQDEEAVAGVNGIEWDAVELPSQFMEYWLDEGPEWVVDKVSRHLPQETFCRLKHSLKYHQGAAMLGQVDLGTIDMDLHQHPLKKGETITQRRLAVAQEKHTTVTTILPTDRFLNHFSHIFSGGYAAGYYSYKWAEVLSADAFAAFEDEGALENTTAGEQKLHDTGRRFLKTVLAKGGGEDPAEVFREFRGRDPSVTALLRYSFSA